MLIIKFRMAFGAHIYRISHGNLLIEGCLPKLTISLDEAQTYGALGQATFDMILTFWYFDVVILSIVMTII